MTRVEELRDGITRAQERAKWARRQLNQLDNKTGNSEAEKRGRRKLADDLALAENDVAVLERALEEETRPSLSHSEARAFAEGVEVGEDA
jgi:hypothetical protein